MKTKQLFKGLLLIFAMVLSGCGKDNVSGNQNNGLYGGAIGIPGQYGNAIYAENPCRVNAIPTYGYPTQQNIQGRQTIVVRLQGVNVAIGSSYIGVTSEGDIANVYNDGRGPVMAMQLCNRGFAAQGQLLGNPIINNSLNCQVDEITQAQVVLPGMFGQIYLNFRPIYFSGSSLCGGGMGQFPGQFPGQYPYPGYPY